MHFALVHGAYHGAWCWDLLRTELKRDGHSTSAVDLPCEDPEAGAECYAELVIRAIPPGKAAVLVCALVPVPGLSFDAQHANIATGFHPSAPAISHSDGSASWPEAGAIEVFYHDCEPKIARDAARRLRRQHWRVTQEVTPLHELPAVSAAYILCTDDRMVSSEYSRRSSQKLLGFEPVEIRGGHSPFLAHPRELATLLERVSSGAPEGTPG
jgi:hypothetical protein